MIKLSIPDMTCSHCAGTVTKAIKSVDADATVTVDYGTKVVTVESSAAATSISSAVDEAGYPNTVN
ncbi:MAG: heavy-metal-associated domain-containing protein [Alphaproteobacteria bacterium]|nr:heavy-metal-associated domain-containing protein [Alphaproteobacteria bacterium]